MLAALILWIGIGGTENVYNTARHDNVRNILLVASHTKDILLEEDSSKGQVDAAPILWVLARPPLATVATPDSSLGGYLQRGNKRTTPQVVAALEAEGDSEFWPLAQAIICAEGTPWPCEWARAVVGCESSFQTDAWATEVIDGVRHYFHGWFQHISESPEPGPLADPVYNTARAEEKYRSGGTSHWPNCP